MDRPLDDLVAERRSRAPRRRQPLMQPRDGVRKNRPPPEPRTMDREWVHDRFDDDEYNDDYQVRGSRPSRDEWSDRRDNDRHNTSYSTEGTKLRVENIHYDLTERHVKELFARIGPVTSVKLLYDRHDRSEGVAYVIYDRYADAKTAVQEYDGANANGQPIRLSIVPNSASRGADSTSAPSRSLFERIDGGGGGRAAPRTERTRSHSPPRRPRDRDRDSERQNAREDIDRYVPPRRAAGANDGMRRTHTPRGGARNSGPRRESDRAGPRGGGGTAAGTERQAGARNRPKKTVDQLDAEMDDYWGSGNTGDQTAAAAATGPAPAAAAAPVVAAGAGGPQKDANGLDTDMID